MNDKSKNSGKKTLLWSIITSAPGPLVVGIGLIVGKSSTQLADFIRRAIELLAIILSFVTYSITIKDNVADEDKKAKLEMGTGIFISLAMITSGVIMLILALTSKDDEKGNVIFGLIIAVLGVIANCYFWLRYKKLGVSSGNAVLLSQSKLYRAKTFVDFSVTLSLSAVLLSTSAPLRYYFDLIGTIAVSAYLILTGITSLLKQLKKQ